MKKLFALVLTVLLAAGTVTLPALAATPAMAQSSAELLYSLGLFRGVGNNADGTPNFDLNRSTTRAEAVTMLVRLLGAEEQAQRAVQALPFSDVPNWARPYVSYAYRQGYTKGISATLFGPSETVTPAQYLTFLLRTLGYADGTDFSWKSPFTLSDQLGVTNGEYSASSSFLRGDAAVVSANALTAQRKADGKTMLEQLASQGILSDRNLVIWGCTPLNADNGYVSFLFYPVKGSPSTFSTFKVDKVTVNGQSCQTLQVTNTKEASAYLASIGESSGGFGYIEVTFDQNAALAAAKETFRNAAGKTQPWLIFDFSCTGVRMDGVKVTEEFVYYQAPV